MLLPFGGIALCFGLVSAAILVIAVFMIVRIGRATRRTAELKRVGVHVIGTVISNQMESRTSSSSAPETMQSHNYLVFRPVVHFRTQTGEEITAVGLNVSRQSFVAGTQVPLIHHPDRLTEVMVEGGPGGGSVISVVVAGFIALVALGFLIALLFFAGFVGLTHPDSTCPPDFPAGVSCN